MRTDTCASTANPGRVFVLPFLCAFLACPAFVVVHEWGHFLTGKALGWTPQLHYAETTFDAPKEKFTDRNNNLVTAGGPLVGMVLAAAGFLWLRALRAGRREGMATPADWLATTLALNAGRWLRSLVGSPSHPLPDDEAWMSRSLGLPGWVLPYALGVIAMVVLVATVRLHPPKGRLIPFLWLGVGGVLGTLLWMKVVGPFVLP